MAAYSVADAKAGLSRLIDRALEGEEVIITRHGKPVVELRKPAGADHGPPVGSLDWLKARREGRASIPFSSVDLLDAMYDDPEG